MAEKLYSTEAVDKSFSVRRNVVMITPVLYLLCKALNLLEQLVQSGCVLYRMWVGCFLPQLKIDKAPGVE